MQTISRHMPHAAFGLATLGLTVLALAPVHAQATFTASLNGAQEPSTSTATGTGFVFLNAAQDQITVDLSWTGLTSGAVAGHIHGPAAPGANASVLFPFTNVPATTSGSIPEQTFAVTPVEVADLQNGLLYFNIHTLDFSRGEIRGQILPAAVPEASTTVSLGLLLALGLGSTVIAARKKARASA